MFGSKKQEPNYKIELGSKVKDKITGFTGIVIHRTQWLHNCNTYGLKPQELKDGKPIDVVCFDEPQLEVVEEEVIEKKRKTGGPCETPQRTNR